MSEHEIGTEVSDFIDDDQMKILKDKDIHSAAKKLTKVILDNKYKWLTVTCYKERMGSSVTFELNSDTYGKIPFTINCSDDFAEHVS